MDSGPEKFYILCYLSRRCQFIVSFTFQASQCWRAALEFTTRFLTAHGQGVGQKGQRALHTHKTLQVRNKKLYLTSWYATVKFYMDFVQPWFVKMPTARPNDPDMPPKQTRKQSCI